MLDLVLVGKENPDLEWTDKMIAGVLIIWLLGLLAVCIALYGIYQYAANQNESGLWFLCCGLGLNFVIAIGAMIAGRVLNLRK